MRVVGGNCFTTSLGTRRSGTCLYIQAPGSQKSRPVRRRLIAGRGATRRLACAAVCRSAGHRLERAGHQRIDPKTDGRWDPRGDVRENAVDAPRSPEGLRLLTGAPPAPHPARSVSRVDRCGGSSPQKWSSMKGGGPAKSSENRAWGRSSRPPVARSVVEA